MRFYANMSQTLADVAVGAPYDGSGRVYIYCGSQEGISKVPAQVRLCVCVAIIIWF